MELGKVPSCTEQGKRSATPKAEGGDRFGKERKGKEKNRPDKKEEMG